MGGARNMAWGSWPLAWSRPTASELHQTANERTKRASCTGQSFAAVGQFDKAADAYGSSLGPGATICTAAAREGLDVERGEFDLPSV
jgi:hypothetical protein